MAASKEDELDVFTNPFENNEDVSRVSTSEYMLKDEVETKPQGKLPQACWRLRAVRRTLTGGYLTERVFIPRCVYFQTGSKIIGLNLKIDCYSRTSVLFQNFIAKKTSHEPPSIDHSKEELQQTLHSISLLNHELNNIRDRLHRAFPSMISHSNNDRSGGGDKVESGSFDDLPDMEPKREELPLPPPLDENPIPSKEFAGLGGLWGAAAGRTRALGRSALALTRTAAEASTEIAANAGKSAFSAVRFSLIPERITDENSSSLVIALDSLCIDAQIFGIWYQSLINEKKSAQEIKTNKIDNSVEELIDEILDSLVVVGEFLQDVILEVVIKDVESLFAIFMSQMVKTLTASSKIETSSTTSDSLNSTTSVLSSGITSDILPSSQDFGLSVTEFASDFFTPSTHDDLAAEEF